jgi:hypothetical protein
MAVQTRLTAKKGRNFAFTVGTAFLVLGAISAWRGHVWPPRVMWTLGGVLLLAGLFLPGKLGPVYRFWMALGTAISKVTQPIVVAASYYVFLTPIGVLLRVFGRNSTRHKERGGGFWVPVDRKGGSNLSNQF